MDIRNWPMDKIMQLPDHCFGRRFVVSCYSVISGAATAYDMSELSLPDGFMLWEVVFFNTSAANKLLVVRLALGNVLPASPWDFNLLSPLLPGLGVQGADPRQITFTAPQTIAIQCIKQPFESGNRKLVVEVIASGVGSSYFGVSAIVSSIPTEVPDWLVSGPANSL